MAEVPGESTAVSTQSAVPVGQLCRIASAEDLVSLSRNCILDSRSDGMIVSLEADIDLSQSDFSRIPIFQGTFLGNGHKITGFSMTNNEVATGFFGILTEKATVSNLTLEGNVTPDGVLDYAGGLVGINRGSITGCSFHGTVRNTAYTREIEGEQTTGGIAGINEETGSIVACHVIGSVDGIKYTGGIAGKNLGLISQCISMAKVNTMAEDRMPSIRELTSIRGLKDVIDVLNVKKIYATENTGGICGYSGGSVLYCVNKETVGSRDNGYKVGGIVGRSSGFIYACENTAEVYGNENVGGILGQLEPRIRITEGRSVLKAGDFHRVFGAVSDFTKDTDTALAGISKSIDLALKDIDGAVASVAAMENAVTDIADTKIAEVNNITGVADDLVQNINQATAMIKDVTGGLEDLSVDATGMAESINAAMGHVSNATTGISARTDQIVETIEEAAEEITNELNADSCDLVMKARDPSAIPELDRLSMIQVRVYDKDSSEILGYEVMTEETGWELEIGKIPLMNDEGEMRNIGLLTNGIPREDGGETVYIVEAAKTKGTKQNTVYFEITGVTARPGEPVSEEKEEVTIRIDWEEGFISSSPEVLPVYLYYCDATLPDSEKVHYYYKTEALIKDEDVEKRVWTHSVMLPAKLANGHAISWIGSYTDYDVLTATKFYEETVAYSDGVLSYIMKKSTGVSKGITGFITKVSGYASKTSAVLSIGVEAGKSVGSDLKTLLSRSTSELSYGVGEFKHATSYLEALTADLALVSYKINNLEFSKIRGIEGFSPVGDQLDEKTKELQGHLSDLIGHIADINRQLDGIRQSFSGNVSEIVDASDEMTDNVFGLLEDLSLSIENLLSTAYDENYVLKGVLNASELPVGNEGCLFGCKNTGAVSGGTMVGGIVGTMEITGMPSIVKADSSKEDSKDSSKEDSQEESKEDSEKDSKEDGEKGLSVPGFTYTALVRDCEARGSVEAEEDYAGLICGKQLLGSIIGCKTNGTAKSRKGSYVGGIAGLAHAGILDCSVRGSFSGKYYIGGICGSGSEAETIYITSGISGCSAYVEQLTAEQYRGSISGSSLGQFSGNTYVENPLQGVNGYASDGKFLPISAEEFTKAHPELTAVGVAEDAEKHFDLADHKTLKWILILSAVIAFFCAVTAIKNHFLAKRVVRYLNADVQNKITHARKGQVRTGSITDRSAEKETGEKESCNEKTAGKEATGQESFDKKTAEIELEDIDELMADEPADKPEEKAEAKPADEQEEKPADEPAEDKGENSHERS